MSNKQLIHFGQAIKELREKLGISQEELAELCNLHRTYVGSVERGERNISLVNIIKLAHALKVTPSQILEKIK